MNVIFSNRKNLRSRLERINPNPALVVFHNNLALQLADQTISVAEYVKIFANCMREHITEQVLYETVRNDFSIYSENLFSPDSTLKQRNLTYTNFWRSVLPEARPKNLPAYGQTIEDVISKEMKVVSEQVEVITQALGTDTEVYMEDEVRAMTAKELGELLGIPHVGKKKAELIERALVFLSESNRLLT